MKSLESPVNPPNTPPPRAFTQGLGTIFQFVGVGLFIVMMFVCCASGLLSKATSEQADFSHIGWHLPGDATDSPTLSAQRMLTAAVPMGVMFGIALATLGLGLQATHRRAPLSAVLLTLSAIGFWLLQTIFVVQILHSYLLGILGAGLILLFIVLLAGSMVSYRDMRQNPPPKDHELLPLGYQVPYSHIHQDPPEIRLARELEDRRQKLAVQQKELEMLEEKLKRKYPS